MENSPSVAKAVAAEDRIIGVRIAVIAFNILVYWTLLERAGHRTGLAVLVSIVAGFYAVAVLVLNPVRNSAALRRSWFTVATDSALIAFWLLATGASTSPFHPLWAVSLVAVAFRFGPRVTVLATVLYAGLDAAVVLSDGVAAFWPDGLVRVAYVGFVGALGALVARESGEQFRRRMAVEDEGRRWRVEQERLRSLAETTMEGVVLHEGGVVVEANAPYARLVGQPLEALRGAPEPILAGSRNVGPTEVPWTGPDGTARILRVQQRPYLYRDRQVMVAAVRDVTEERRAERMRIRSREQDLEIRRLQEMDRFKTDFINAAAHELNTPLTPLKLQLHLLRRGGDPTRVAHSVDILDRNLERLGGLVQDMLDVAKMQSGRLRLECQSMDVGQAVWDVADTYQEEADQRGITLDAEPPRDLTVHADPARVGQVLHNLVSNALKFTQSPGTVAIRTAKVGNNVRITVSDTGIGLSARQRAELFQPFAQVHAGVHPGTGLGLYISHNLVSSMGGSVWCESDGPGTGSSFHVVLPTTPPEPGTARQDGEGGGRAAGASSATGSHTRTAPLRPAAPASAASTGSTAPAPTAPAPDAEGPGPAESGTKRP